MSQPVREPGVASIERNEILSRVTRIETILEQFVTSTAQRMNQQDREIDDVKTKQGDTGKWSWTAVGVVISGVGILVTVIGALAILYIAPVKTAQESAETRMLASIESLHVNERRLEEDRRRDEDKFDERLQREMRLINEVVVKGLESTKEMVEARLLIDEKRIDDVTYRYDRSADEYRQKLHEIWSAPYINPGTKP